MAFLEVVTPSCQISLVVQKLFSICWFKLNRFAFPWSSCLMSFIMFHLISVSSPLLSCPTKRSLSNKTMFEWPEGFFVGCNSRYDAPFLQLFLTDHVCLAQQLFKSLVFWINPVLIFSVWVSREVLAVLYTACCISVYSLWTVDPFSTTNLLRTSKQDSLFGQSMAFKLNVQFGRLLGHNLLFFCRGQNATFDHTDDRSSKWLDGRRVTLVLQKFVSSLPLDLTSAVN